MSPRSCCAKFSFQRDFAQREQSDTREQCDTEGGGGDTAGTGVSCSHEMDASGSLVGQECPIPVGWTPQAALAVTWDRACSNGVFYRNSLTVNEAFQEFWAGLL